MTAAGRLGAIQGAIVNDSSAAREFLKQHPQAAKHLVLSLILAKQWLAEVKEAPPHTLDNVLDYFTSFLSGQLAESLEADGLAAIAETMPDSATAVDLIDWIEAQKFPGGVRITIPDGGLPAVGAGLSRKRAERIAMQAVDEGGVLVFDVESEADLHRIESIANPVDLQRLWQNCVQREALNICSSSGAAASSEVDRLPTINHKLSLIWYGGDVYQVSANQVLMFEAMINAYPLPTSMKAAGLTKASEVKNALPESLRKLIISKKGQGYRLVVD